MSYSNGPRIVTDGLVLYLDAGNSKSYPGSGNTWYDLSGNNFQGELVNTPTYTTNNSNKFFAFATNDYVRISNSTLLDTQTPTVEMVFGSKKELLMLNILYSKKVLLFDGDIDLVGDTYPRYL